MVAFQNPFADDAMENLLLQLYWYVLYVWLILCILDKQCALMRHLKYWTTEQIVGAINYVIRQLCSLCVWHQSISSQGGCIHAKNNVNSKVTARAAAHLEYNQPAAACPFLCALCGFLFISSCCVQTSHFAVIILCNGLYMRSTQFRY